MDNTEFEGRVRSLIEERIRPSLLNHGGDIRIKEIKGRDVGLVFQGACRTCPAAQITLEEVIEKTLREELPETGRVYLINETDPELLAFAKTLMHGKK
ncbi:MAG: NifU family protein [Bacteroides sp.]|nr:NifU family protein [Bacteroides sp.]MCM1085354.1 NifU family protein [Bacteroides sp.]MCM1169426.1 NifU family protein [Bacteroides sp.]MCM1532435.1 NifU family protein [Ruminococcus flavefaciens]MCM1555613.1 NifU family protein [Bacteroides sp.]